MKTVIFGLLMAAALATASELAGTWEGKLTDGAKPVYAGFDLEVAGDRVTGGAYIEGWGASTVSEGRLEGDRFRFRVARGRASTSTVEFSGVVSGKVMTLTMFDGMKQDIATLDRTESHATGPVSVDAAPGELQGKWLAHWVGRIGDRPKMIGEIEFDFRVDGNTLGGMAHMSGWPGDCPISDGKVANGRFSFTATGRLPSSSGFPVMRFEGEIHGKILTLTMGHPIFGADNGERLPMDAVRM